MAFHFLKIELTEEEIEISKFYEREQDKYYYTKHCKVNNLTRSLIFRSQALPCLDALDFLDVETVEVVL